MCTIIALLLYCVDECVRCAISCTMLPWLEGVCFGCFGVELVKLLKLFRLLSFKQSKHLSTQVGYNEPKQGMSTSSTPSKGVLQSEK